TAEPDVQRGGAGPRCDDGVRGVGRAALYGVDGRGIAEREVLGHIGGRQGDRWAAVEPLGAQAAVRPDGGDAVGLPVDRPAGVALVSGEIPRVAPGLDEVAHTGDSPPARGTPASATRPSPTNSARSSAETSAACSLVSTTSTDRLPATVSASHARAAALCAVSTVPPSTIRPCLRYSSSTEPSRS